MVPKKIGKTKAAGKLGVEPEYLDKVLRKLDIPPGIRREMKAWRTWVYSYELAILARHEHGGADGVTQEQEWLAEFKQQKTEHPQRTEAKIWADIGKRFGVSGSTVRKRIAEALPEDFDSRTEDLGE